MKPREEVRAVIIREWVHKADMDLSLAEYLLAESAAFPSAIAFHCQQAAEKYLKALLVKHEVEFPKTHDIRDLLNLVGGFDHELAASLREAEALTPFGVELRYPGDLPDAMPEEASDAVVLAQQVRDTILPRLKAQS